MTDVTLAFDCFLVFCASGGSALLEEGGRLVGCLSGDLLLLSGFELGGVGRGTWRLVELLVAPCS